MAGEQTSRKSSDIVEVPEGDLQYHAGGVYRCLVYLMRDPAGGFRAVPARLPSATAHGATVHEALSAAVAAVEAALRARGNGKPPWTQAASEPPVGALVRSVIVRA